MSIWTIAVSELKRVVRARSILALLLITPLVLIFILGLALAEEFEPKDREIGLIQVGLIDKDQDHMARLFEQFSTSPELEEVLFVIKYEQEEALQQDMEEGSIDVGLIIPEGFTAAIMSGEAVGWELILGRDRTKNRTAQLVLDSFVAETNRQQAMVMVLSPHIALPLLEERSAPSGSSSYVSTGRLTNSEDSSSALQYYSVTMMVMFLLFSGLTAAMSFIREKETHTLGRLQSLPITSLQIISGKLLGNGLFAALQALLIILVTMFVYGVDWGNQYIYLLLISVLTIVASMGLGFIMAFLFTSSKSLSGAFTAFIGVMTFISGGMSPDIGGVMDIMRLYTINYWSANSFLHVMLGQDMQVVHQNMTILSLICLALLCIAFGLYRRVGYHE